MAGIVLDRMEKELRVGDICAFSSYDSVHKGYVYKITNEKIYVTRQSKDKRPEPDSHMFHDTARWRILKL